MQDFFPADKEKVAWLQAHLTAACEGLVYTSETDAPLTPITLSPIEFRQLTEEKTVEEVSYRKFFDGLTLEQEWWGEQEKGTARKFAELQKVLEENLGGLRVLKVGQVQIDIYIGGTDDSGQITGVQTKAVET